MKSKFNIRRFFKYFIPFALFTTVVTTVILSSQLNNQNNDQTQNNLLNNSISNDTISNTKTRSNDNNSNQEQSSKSLEKLNQESSQQKIDFYPNKTNGVLNLVRPNDVYNNSSLWPKFEFGSNTISLNLSNNVNSSAVNFSNFSYPFAYSKMVESVPINESTDMNNTFIGYQVYQNGNLVNSNNYGSTLNQSLENSDGKNLVNNVNFKNFNPLYLNANSSAIFSISGAGVENNYLNQLDNKNLFKFVAPIQQENNFYIDNSNNYVPGTKFFYNFVVFNNIDTNKYEFYIPNKETTFNISFNGQNVNYDGQTSQTFTTKNSNITASQFAIEMYNGNLEYTNQFNLSIYNSLNSYNGNDVKFEFVANDEVGLLNVNLVIKNFLAIEQHNGKNVYKIIPEKRFDNVFSIKGFKPSKSYNLSLNFLSESTIRKNFNNQIVQIGDITNGFGIYSNYANIFAVNNSNESERYAIDWTPNSTSNPTWQNIFNNKPIKFIDLNLKENVYSPSIVQEYWSNLISFANNYTGYATIANEKDQSSIQDSKFSFSRPENSIDNSSNQWISLSYWNSSFNNYIFSNQYNSVNPVNYGQNINISQPFFYGNGQKKYFSIFNKTNTTGDSSISNNNELVLNLRIRNDSLDLNNINSTKILNFGDSTTLFNNEVGHAYENIGINKFYEYLTGVVSIYNNIVYWVAPSWDTSNGNKTNIFIDPINKIIDSTGNNGSGISEITPSEYLNSKDPIYKLNLNFLGATLSTITNSKIIAYPNDIDGTIDFTIVPGIGVNSNIVSGNNSSINNNQIREYELTQLDPIHFTIEGFKKTNVLQDTILKSSTYNISDSIDGIFKDAYITYAIDNYLETSQTISKEILDRKNDIITDAIKHCIDNIYDPITNKKIIVNSYNDIASLISNVKLEIPQNLMNTGYNHLVLSFDLNGIVSGGLITNSAQHFELNIQFKLPEKIETTFNPLVALNTNDIPDSVQNDTYNKGAISNQNIYDILKNVSDTSNISNRYNLLNFLLTGYQTLTNLNSNSNIFNVTFDKYNTDGSFQTMDVQKEVFRNQFIFGYPTDFYKAYGSSYKNNDELDPVNSWTLTDLILNNDSVSFNLGLKYYVNDQGIITTQNNTSTNKIFGNKFKGVESTQKTTTLLNPAPPGFLTTDSNVLASELLSSYTSKTQLWNTIAKRISQSIINLPSSLNSLDLIAQQLVIIDGTFSYNNLNGIATFDLGIKQALINGYEYTNNATPFKLGTVTVYGFKKVKQTTLKLDFNANIINVNGTSNSLDILGEKLTIEQLNQVIKDNGLLNYPSNVTVNICKKDGSTISLDEMKNYIIYDNLNGSITLDSSKVSIKISNYYDDKGSLQNQATDFLTEGKVVINGFKTITPTSLISNEFIVDGSELIYDYLENDKLNKNKAKQIVIRYINSVPDGFSPSNIYIDDSDVTIDKQSNTITFKVKSNYYFDSLGNLIGQKDIPADNTNSYPIENNVFTISGFNVDNNNKTTITNEAGETFTNLNTYIASNYVDLSNSTDYGYNFVSNNEVAKQLKNQLIQYIINSISSGYKLIINAPSDLSVNNIDIFIDSVNNQTGVIKLNVYSNKYFNNGILGTSVNKNYLLGKINIGGFRKLPNETSLSNTLVEISSLSNVNVNDPTVDEFYIEKIISKNIFTIFSNIPNVDQAPLINPDNPNCSKNKLDYPTFNFNPQTINDSNVKVSITNRNPSNGEITCSISLNSYYSFDANANTIIWSNNISHNFGEITIKGFKAENKTTSVSSKLDLRSFENTQSLQSKHTTDVIKEYTNEPTNELKLFITNNAIINKPDGFTISNVLINNFSSDNKNGILNCDVTLNMYYKNNVIYPQGNGHIDFSSPDALKFSISISGFKPALPTSINSIINMNGTLDADKYPSDFKPSNPSDINLIKNIILNNIQNKPIDFSIDNIIITNWTSNNKNGEIIINDVILNNYYNDTDNNNISHVDKNFGPIKLINFKTISNATSVITNYSVNSNQLPFEWLGMDQETKLIDFIKLNNLISNYPSNLFNSPNTTLKISNIVADNIKGQITFNLKIKDYFTANGDYIIGDENNQSNWLSKDITLIGFKTIQPTSIESQLNYSIFQTDFPSNKTATSLLAAIPSNEQAFISLIFNNAINYKFLGLANSDLKIDLSTAVANNIDGTLKIDVSLSKYINSSGIYVDATNKPELSLKQTILISGFDQVNQTYITSTATSYSGTEIAQDITEQQAIQFVFDNLIVNKPIDMTIGDLQIKDWQNRIFNNNLGQLSFEIGMINHYYDENGTEVLNPKPTPDKWYTVNLIVHNTVLPTTSKPNIDISSSQPDWSNILPSDFVNINNGYKQQLNDFLFNKQNPQDTFTNVLLNLPKNFNSTDAYIENVQDQNGNEVLAEANNINGTIKVTMLINNYYDEINAEHINNNQKPLRLTTILTGFKKIDPNLIIQIPSEIQLPNDDPDYASLINSLASDYDSKNDPNYLNSNSIISTLILNNIKQWNHNNSNGIPELMGDNQKRQNFRINSLVSNNIDGTLVAKIQIKDFYNDNGICQTNWSTEYSIVIRGFRTIKPTIFNNANINLSGPIGEELANIFLKNTNIYGNYTATDQFQDINLSNINNVQYEMISYLVFSNIRTFLIDPPATVNNFINGRFNQNEFNSYFSIKNIVIDYQNGSISLDVGLNTYFSPSDGSLIQNNQNQLISHFVFNGFFKTKPTIIKTNSQVNGELAKQAASEFANNKPQLIRYIKDHKEQFFENLTSDFNFNNDMTIGNIVSNNEFGTITFDISITNYFNENGEFINDKAKPLIQKYTLSGFLSLNETQMTQFINIGLESNRIFGPNIGPNSIDEITADDIGNGLYNYANGNQTIINTFSNLPPNFSRSNIIIDNNRNNWNIDYENGEIKLNVGLSLYVNEKHEIINDPSNPKYFSLTIFGFNKITGPTKVANEISISDPIYGISNMYSTDFNIESFNNLLRNEKFINTLLSPIPGDFNYRNDIQIISIYNCKDIDKIPADAPIKNLGTTEVLVSFTYKHFYIQDEATKKIRLSNDNETKTGYVKLTGFAEFKETKINANIWDLQTTNAAYLYPGSIQNDDPRLLQALSKVKNQYIDNQYYSNDGTSTKIVSVKKEQTTVEELENGELWVSIGIINYFTQNGPVTGVNNTQTFKIKCIGFKKQNVTVASKDNVTVSISGTSLASNIPSKSYEQTNILKILNQAIFMQQIIPPENIVKNNDGSYLTRFASIVSPIDGQGQQIHVDDSNGTITISLKVTNTYDPQTGTITSNETTLNDAQGKLVKITITGFRRAKNTTFNNLNKQILNSYMSKTHSQVFYIDQFIIDPTLAREYLAANIINAGSDGVNQSVVNVNNITISTDPIKNFNNGTITYSFEYSGAYIIDSVANLKKQNAQANQLYQYFDDSSMVLSTTTLTGTFVLNGFSIINEQTNNFLFYFSIAAASTIGLILLISLIVILARRRIR